jgi:hypothetical protein
VTDVRHQIRDKTNGVCMRHEASNSAMQDRTGKAPVPRWCPPGLTKTQRRRLQKLRKNEIEHAREEAARNAWFNEAHPMKIPEKMWTQKRIECKGSTNSEGPAPDEELAQGGLEVNMVFELPAEFWAPEAVVAELVLGPNMATFEKPEKLGDHMKPLFITSHVEGRPV